ncbi:disulfide isomerase DsbC N-terminal domain-containing protein [Aeromonas diversa]|uniref:disulfide isomerase DsbC N-terminal domain-containing protein n=2 Tax=Aeromonas diversa TaxID=502790 RepID=UPI0039A101A6
MIKTFFLIGMLLCGSMTARAAEQQLSERIHQRLGIRILTVSETPISGLYRLETPDGILYSDGAGDYVLQGALLDIRSGVVNMTLRDQQRLRKQRLEREQQPLLQLRASPERYRLQLFTALDCGECLSMGQELAVLQQAGVSVSLQPIVDRRQAWPQFRQQWCSKIPTLLAFDLPEEGCDAILERQTSLAGQLGIRRSPTWVLPNGDRVSGYRSPSQLLQLLKNS